MSYKPVLVVALMGLGLAVSAQAAVHTYTAVLDGPSEPTPSPGIGSATVHYDDVAHTLHVLASFSGLDGLTTNAHIHAPTLIPLAGTASVATQTPTFSGFPSGVQSGNYDNTFDLTLASSWNASFITGNGGTPAGAEAAFASYLAAGRTYFNIHSSIYGGGEIRGFLVPEPATLCLVGIGAAALGYRRRRPV